MVRASTRRLTQPLLALLLALESWADDRLGSYGSSIPIIRSSAINTVDVNVGDPEQQLKLALTTGADYIAVANSSCTSCFQEAAGFNTSSSSSTGMSDPLLRELEYPPGQPRLNGTFMTDTRAIGEVSDRGSILVINGIDIEVGQRDKERSFLYSANGGRFTLGIDTERYEGLRTVGRLDWGGVNKNRTDGNFDWVKTNTSWTFGFRSIDVQGGSIDGEHLQASVDPGLNAIYAPLSVAADVYAKLDAVQLVATQNRTRWKVPCDAKLKFELKLEDGRAFGVASDLLRMKEGETCFGAVYAWANHSAPDNDGKIRLGTPFLDEWYTALYYAEGDPQVGFAKHRRGGDGSGPNSKLIGGLVGSLVPLMLIFLAVVYARNSHPMWLRSYYDRWYDWNHAQAVHAARAGMGPPPHDSMPWRSRMLHGLFGPPTYMDPMPGYPLMRGTPMPQFGPHMHPPMWPPPMQPGMTGMPLPMQPGMTGMPPPMQPGMTGMPLQPGMTGMPPPPPPPMQPMMTGAPLQPMPTGMPGAMPGLAPHLTGRPRTAMPYPSEFGGLAPGQHPHASWSGSGRGLGPDYGLARQEVIDIMSRPYSRGPGPVPGQMPMPMPMPMAPGMTGPVPMHATGRPYP